MKPTGIPAPPHPPRRQLDLPWPEYRYVPGLQAHPLRGGHGGHGLGPKPTPDLAEVRGWDLLRAWYVWEAHEAFEAAWHQVGGARREVLGARIKLCAAILRRHLGDFASARSLLERARPALTAPEDVRWVEAVVHFLDSGDWASLPGGADPNLATPDAR
jgi:hypothetical protein